MWSGAHQHERDSDRRSSIPVIVRIAKALSKMKLQPFAVEAVVEEALRLFHVSTLDAALFGILSGVESFTSQEDQDSIIKNSTKQKYPERALLKVLQLMLRRGEIQHRMQHHWTHGLAHAPRPSCHCLPLRMLL
ncbi:minichromosome maintenance protein 5 [Saguinus oedipus]|uniref:Minichromosome maintenance protein 5 n=1 Tax=Saguinus oedipus TaxID=9490 RepID=A0ABQ9TYS2_SAGOE|nr:minichromosome maintenance protein 5 [Saguinus oedipus]